MCSTADAGERDDRGRYVAGHRPRRVRQPATPMQRLLAAAADLGAVVTVTIPAAAPRADDPPKAA